MTPSPTRPRPRKHGAAFVGISGWRYAHWRGVFYPPGLAQRRELEHVASLLRSVEVNGSFYSLIRPSTYEAWAEATPDGFRFALKGSRYITHMLRLRGAERALANFFASGVLRLGPKLGPILWQLPPRFVFEADRLARFFELLPRDHAAIAALATRHDARMRGRVELEPRTSGPVRHAIEIRHESFEGEAFARLCREHDVAIAISDTAGKFPMLFEDTSDFVYVRLHGAEELYVSGYDLPALRGWAARVRAWTRAGRDAFVYFDNDVRARAPFDAMALAALVEGRRPEGLPASLASVTEEARTLWPAWTSRSRRPAARRLPTVGPRAQRAR